jgi:hypothetical protein
LNIKAAAVVRVRLNPSTPAAVPVEILLSVSAEAKIAPSFIVTWPEQRSPAANGSLSKEGIPKDKVFLRANIFSEDTGVSDLSGSFFLYSMTIIHKPMLIRRKAPR